MDKKKRFIDNAIAAHGNKYDYSLVDYKNNKMKVKIICKEHGIFEQTPNKHTSRKDGCPKCSGKHKPSTEEFIERANVVHNNKYDYSLAVYKNNSTKVDIICQKHGIFKQIPANHIFLKQGCRKCTQNILTTEEFIQKSNEIHNNKYDYSLTVYKNAYTKIKIICPSHGEFEQYTYSHLNRKQGCQFCNKSKGEDVIYEYLKINNIEFERQKKFDECKHKKRLPFDFYLSRYNLCIEFDGIQHFEKVEYWRGNKKLEDQQLKDKIKTDFCKNADINLLRIPYTEFNNIKEILEKYIK